MNDNRQMEINYTETGFPYLGSGSFMNFFEGFNHVPQHYTNAGPSHNQESVYWSMNMNSYKFEEFSPGSTSYYSPYEESCYMPRSDMGDARAWEYHLAESAVHHVEDPIIMESPSRVDDVIDEHSTPEECIVTSEQSSSSSQAVWQEDIDPDNMTYEELLDLGEAIGSEGKGLSKELINLLPTSKYKFSDIFSRKKSSDRCVICQMRYKRGDRQMKLPCKHLYHDECITKWLTINKICPVCNVEVFGEESSRH